MSHSAESDASPRVRCWVCPASCPVGGCRRDTLPISPGEDDEKRSQTVSDEPTAEKDVLCIECGDHRGWRVEPDRNTGEAVQVQCRACYEHVCPSDIPPDADQEANDE